jgi:uncharacterized RDD family membrane protein YckC
MTSAHERSAAGSTYPWREEVSLPVATTPSSLVGTRAGLVTRSLANVADLVVVVLVVLAGYAAVSATRFLLRPAHFRFPAPSWELLLLLVLGVQAVYFALTWAMVGGTYGDRLLGLCVTDDHRARLGWKRCTLRAVLCTIFPIGLLWVLVSQENRSVQDVLLRTSVAYD